MVITIVMMAQGSKHPPAVPKIVEDVVMMFVILRLKRLPNVLKIVESVEMAPVISTNLRQTVQRIVPVVTASVIQMQEKPQAIVLLIVDHVETSFVLVVPKLSKVVPPIVAHVEMVFVKLIEMKLR